MDIEIKKKRPITFGIKVAIIIIVASVILGGLLRVTSKSSPSTDGVDANPVINGTYGNIFVPVITLSVNGSSNEKEWTEALANRINGQSEVRVDQGRVDVMTNFYAIELDFIKKWHEGLRQAIHYGDETKRIGVLALIDETDNQEQDFQHFELIRKIERLCSRKGIRLVILRSAE